LPRRHATPRHAEPRRRAGVATARRRGAMRGSAARLARARATSPPLFGLLSQLAARSLARSFARFIPPDYCCAQRPCHQPARVVVVVLAVVVVVAAVVVVVVVVVWLACRPTSTL